MTEVQTLPYIEDEAVASKKATEGNSYTIRQSLSTEKGKNFINLQKM